jgi:signal transduction histidine kinase
MYTMVMLFELVLLSITNIVILLVLLVVVLSVTIPAVLRIMLAVTVVSLVLWQDTVYISNFVSTSLVFWNNFVFIWPTIAFVSYYIFVQRLAVKNHLSVKSRSAFPAYVAPTLLLIGTVLQCISLIGGKIYVASNSVAGVTRGSGYSLYIIGLTAALISIIIYTAMSLQRTRDDERQHKAILTVLHTVIIACLYGTTTNVILPLATQSQTYAGFGILTIFIFAMGFSLSIIKNRLLDVKWYAVRTVVYILSLTTLGLLYALIAFAISRFVFGYGTSAIQNIVNIALVLILAFIFQPVKEFFDQITNTLFYRDEYSTEEFFTRLTKKLSTMTDLMTLLSYASTEISKTLKASFGAFLVYRANADSVYIAEDRRRKIPPQDLIELDTYIENNTKNVIITNLLDDKGKGKSLKRMLLSHRIALALPIVQGEAVLGYLFLGDHLSSQYTTRDVRALQTIADELTIAIQNALSIQEVKDLNETLQQRIDAATKELRATNAQLHRLDEAKDEFISMASHQLRTPLTSVKGYISMVLEGDAGKVTTTQKQLLGEAFGSSERMVHLINDFLDVSRLQTGKFVIDKKPVDLSLVVKDELAALATNAAQRGMVFNYKMPKKYPTLMLDEGKIRQVIMNFCDNAIYYSKDGSKITVELSVTDKDILFVVKDSGIGVPLDQQAHVFTKFFRATNARTQRPDGTGVGLFLAKKVMIAHGGDVIFESKENKGSTFGFRLPISELNVPTKNVN